MNRRAKHAEIREAYKAELEQGRTVPYSIEPSKNPEWSLIFVAQEKTTGAAKKIDQLLKGWGQRLATAMYVGRTDLILKAGFKAGQALPEGYNIQVQEDFTPERRVSATGQPIQSEPKKAPLGPNDTMVILLGEQPDGSRAPIYQHRELVFGTPQDTNIKHVATGPAVQQATDISQEVVGKTAVTV